MSNTQHFEGELNTDVPGASPEKPILQTTVRAGNELKIAADQPAELNFGLVANQPIVAVLMLGGAHNGETSLLPKRLDIVRIDDPENPDILSLGHRQRVNTARPEEYMLVTYKPDETVEAVSFIKNLERFYVIGREGNAEWIRIGSPNEPETETPDYWTPFNDSVSREQLLLSCQDKSLTIRGLSERSRTDLKTYATAEHKEVLARAPQQYDEKPKKTGRGLLGIVRRK